MVPVHISNNTVESHTKSSPFAFSTYLQRRECPRIYTPPFITQCPRPARLFKIPTPQAAGEEKAPFSTEKAPPLHSKPNQCSFPKPHFPVPPTLGPLVIRASIRSIPFLDQDSRLPV